MSKAGKSMAQEANERFAAADAAVWAALRALAEEVGSAEVAPIRDALRALEVRRREAKRVAA